MIAVNDRSTDETLAIMQKFSYDRLKILNITELPEGWLGKNHALYQGFLASQGDWLLFTDADVRFEPDTLKSCLAEVQKKQADHLALLPAMISKGLLETVFAISFALAFFFRYRPWAVSNKHSKTHVGVGAFNLVRRETYVNIGTHKALALQVLDDMELGRRIKRAGFRQLCASGSRLISVPWVEGWRGVIRSLEKNGFAAFNYQLLRTGFLSFISILMNVFPFWFFLTGNSSEKFLSGNIIFIIALCYAAFSKIFPRAFISFFFHPLGILLVLAVVWRSVFLALRDRGIRWRETFYSLEDLKEHL